MVKNGLPRMALSTSVCEGVPIQLIEVSDTIIEFDNHCAASKFLGLQDETVKTYVKQKTKIIKSKKNGKTYLIRKVKGS